MAIVFDQSVNISHIYRIVGGTLTKVTNTGIVSAFDYFPDTATVGDAIYFGWNYGVWHDLTVRVGTAMAGTSLAGVWEYYTLSGTWATLTCTDNTSGFTQSGLCTVSFSVPDNWTSLKLDSSDWLSIACFIRYRLTTVSGLTEGGANVTSRPSCLDFTIEVNGSTEYTLADLLSAVGGQITNSGSYYNINANLRLGAAPSTAGKLTIRGYSLVEIGSPTKLRSIMLPTTSSRLQIGYYFNTYLEGYCVPVIRTPILSGNHRDTRQALHRKPRSPTRLRSCSPAPSIALAAMRLSLAG